MRSPKIHGQHICVYALGVLHDYSTHSQDAEVHPLPSYNDLSVLEGVTVSAGSQIEYFAAAEAGAADQRDTEDISVTFVQDETLERKDFKILVRGQAIYFLAYVLFYESLAGNNY